MFSTSRYSFLKVKVRRKENKKTLNHTHSYPTANRDRMNNARCMLLILKSRCITHRHLFNFIVLWILVANFIDYFTFLLFLLGIIFNASYQVDCEGRSLLKQTFLSCAFILYLMMVERTTETCRREKNNKREYIVQVVCLCGLDYY